LFPDFLQRNAEAQGSGDRGKDIATVKSVADYCGGQTLIRNLKCLVVCGPSEHERKDAIVRPDKVILTRLYRDRPPLRANSGINNDHVDGGGRKVVVCAEKNVSARINTLGSDFMTDIHNADCWIAAQDGAFHRCNIVIGRPEVGEKSDYAHVEFGKRNTGVGNQERRIKLLSLDQTRVPFCGGPTATSVSNRLRKLSLTDSGAISAIRFV
jgi:hypothetical protein